MFGLNLPSRFVPDRAQLTLPLRAGEREVFAELEGPGCIRHIYFALGYQIMDNRRVKIHIYFDDAEQPQVSGPVGDIFGVMHGKPHYPLNSAMISAQDKSGMNLYFPMPFAKNARIEIESVDGYQGLYLQCDWHRYIHEPLEEPMRFHAKWRRQRPTPRYGDDYLILDADGPGVLAGFVYGVRLIDNVDRWSHGGSDNIYIDGDGEVPVYIRGLGGEDTFGVGYGGATHNPETHIYTGIPYYVHEDVSEARPAQRLVGYRIFLQDQIPFEKSIHMRFGSMCNDICSTAYWYQQGPERQFVKSSGYAHHGIEKNFEMPAESLDLPIPTSGRWQLCGPFGNKDDVSLNQTLESETNFDMANEYDGLHEEESPWLTERSAGLGREKARWVERDSLHNFVDFNHVFRPGVFGACPTHPGCAVATSVLKVEEDCAADLLLAWDDVLIVRINDQIIVDKEAHSAFRHKQVKINLKKGDNRVVLKLSNTKGSNHGGWAFVFAARLADGMLIEPEIE